MYAEIGVQVPLATVALEVQVGYENIWEMCIPSPRWKHLAFITGLIR